MNTHSVGIGSRSCICKTMGFGGDKSPMQTRKGVVESIEALSGRLEHHHYGAGLLGRRAGVVDYDEVVRRRSLTNACSCRAQF